jgi:hypothetical protein
MNDYTTYMKSDQIKKLYESGMSAQEIKDQLNLTVSVRQVQRYIKNWGLSRSVGDAFRLAVFKGRVTYWGKPAKRRKRPISYASL